jgi:WD40 repeat protein
VTLAVDQASDRPLYCLGVNERAHSFVTGGADHSLRVYDFSGTLRRELYSKTSGHTEWVTTCAALSDGRVLSGGMDSKLCLWPSSGPRGVDLLGHAGSISRVMADSRDIGLSASYDRTLRVWSLASRSPRELAVLRGCGGPITAMDWHNSLVLAGTREGQVGLWDINTGARLRWLSPAGNAQLLTLQLGSIEAGVAASSDAAAAGVHDPAAYSWIVAAGGSVSACAHCRCKLDS